jgi:hypothetical protein
MLDLEHYWSELGDDLVVARNEVSSRTVMTVNA